MNSPVRLPSSGLNELRPLGLEASRKLMSNAVTAELSHQHQDGYHEYRDQAAHQLVPNASCVESSVQNNGEQQGNTHVREAFINEPCVKERQGQSLEVTISPGDVLRQRRDRLGWSKDAVAEKLKIRPSFVTALEWNDFDVLPDGPYTLGYYRNYANLLGLPADPIVAAFRSKREQQFQHRVNAELPKKKVMQQLWWQDPYIQKLGVALIVSIFFVLSLIFWPSLSARWANELPPVTKPPVDNLNIGAMNADFSDIGNQILNDTVIVDSSFGVPIMVQALENGDVVYTDKQSVQAAEKQRTGFIPFLQPQG